jgi:formylglycine-generating enzyme required for sulfatase activity
MKKILSFLWCGLLFGGLSGGCGQNQEKTFTNSIGMEFVLIPGGKFTHSWAETTENDSGEESTTTHERVVTISKPFYLGKYEVTQEQWTAVMGMGSNHSRFKGRTNPVENVSWEDVQVFIRKLNEGEGCYKYRLPTEAEWEHAARAGSETTWFFGDDPAAFDQYAWLLENSKNTTHQEGETDDSGPTIPVGKKKPNPWGLYDIYGNVKEWVADFHGDWYKDGAVTDPTGPISGSRRVSRGGGWQTSVDARFRLDDGWLFYTEASTHFQAYHRQDYRDNDLGFRLAFTQDKDFTNSIGMEFVLIPAGTFIMGSAAHISENPTYHNESPAHKVTISKPFYLGKFEVTQEQWQAVMGDNPSEFPGQTNPVENVSWEDAQVFIQKLNEKEGGNKYRLPSEAEWEYAARAGTKTLYFWGDAPAASGQFTWFDGNSQNTTHPVGEKKPNPWGLYDIYGNVNELVQDWYNDYRTDDYSAEAKEYVTHIMLTNKGKWRENFRVFRGGSLLSTAERCRSAIRYTNERGYRNYNLGFRLAYTPW